MKTFIALFRGINIGGHHRLPMKKLVAILRTLGLTNIRTYIQSGNAVFQAGGSTAPALAMAISTAIGKNSGFAPRVLLLTPQELGRAIAGNPFPEAEDDPKSLHLLFLDAVPKGPDLEKLRKIQARTERFALKGRLFYLHAPDGVGRSKLAANAERLLGVPATGRNWRTVLELASMVQPEPRQRGRGTAAL